MKKRKKRITIDDLAGPCNLKYDLGLARYETFKRHSLRSGLVDDILRVGGLAHLGER